jgi:hypothetical protein
MLMMAARKMMTTCRNPLLLLLLLLSSRMGQQQQQWQRRMLMKLQQQQQQLMLQVRRPSRSRLLQLRSATELAVMINMLLLRQRRPACKKIHKNNEALITEG